MAFDNMEALHDGVCSLVEDEFKSRGFKTINHYTYYNNGCRDATGEIDLIAWKKGYKRAVVVEVKYNNHYKAKKKAKKQLHRSEDYCKVLQNYTITKFYAYHSGTGYKLERIR